MSPGAIAVGGGGAETQAVCCVPPGCAFGLPADPCVVVAAWLQLEDQPHLDGQRGPQTPMGFQQVPLAGHAAPLAAHTPSGGSWEVRIRNTFSRNVYIMHACNLHIVLSLILLLLYCCYYYICLPCWCYITAYYHNQRKTPKQSIQ